MISYFIIGFIWLIFHEVMFSLTNKETPFTNGWRIRLFLFWPVTLGAWVIGFYQAWRDSDEVE